MSPEASFEIPPPPIPPGDIRETVEADVVVIGAGISGLTAALSAMEAGANVWPHPYNIGNGAAIKSGIKKASEYLQTA